MKKLILISLSVFGSLAALSGIFTFPLIAEASNPCFSITSIVEDLGHTKLTVNWHLIDKGWCAADARSRVFAAYLSPSNSYPPFNPSDSFANSLHNSISDGLGNFCMYSTGGYTCGSASAYSSYTNGSDYSTDLDTVQLPSPTCPVSSTRVCTVANSGLVPGNTVYINTWYGDNNSFPDTLSSNVVDTAGYTITSAGPPPPTISFNAPTASSTVSDFGVWDLHKTNTDSMVLAVCYSLDSDPSNAVCDTNPVTTGMRSAYDSILNKPYNLTFPGSSATSTNWSATAYLWNATTSETLWPTDFADYTLLPAGSEIASSTISFTVINATTSVTLYPTAIATSSTAVTPLPDNYLWCTPPSNVLDIGGGIYYGGCQVFSWLFNPNNFGDSDLYASFKEFLNTPPFSYVFEIYTQFTTQGNALKSVNSTNLNFAMDSSLPSMIPKTSLAIISASTTIAVFGTHATEFQKMLFTAEDGILLLGLLAVIYNTITGKEKTYPNEYRSGSNTNTKSRFAFKQK